MKILITFIPHYEQRYPTCGDWFIDDFGNLIIKVSKMDDKRFEFLVAFHELIEAKLCLERGITQKQVDDFDFLFEEERERKIHADNAEPGDDPRAPYKKEHFFATNLERLMTTELGVDWSKYEKAINELP